MNHHIIFILSYRKCYQPPAKRTSDSVKKALHFQRQDSYNYSFFVVNFWLTVTETSSPETPVFSVLLKLIEFIRITQLEAFKAWLNERSLLCTFINSLYRFRLSLLKFRITLRKSNHDQSDRESWFLHTTKSHLLLWHARSIAEQCPIFAISCHSKISHYILCFLPKRTASDYLSFNRQC